MPAYDRISHSPPAPVAHVVFRNPAQGAAVDGIAMLLDTGADITLVPASVLPALAVTAQPGKSYELIGFDGSVSSASAVTLELVLNRKVFRGQFLLTDQEWGAIGRNILNSLHLRFEGPALFWEEL